MNSFTRTFIAVDFDDPQVVARAQEVQRRLAEAGAVAKNVESRNLHVTLWFLGELPKHKLDIVLEEAGKVRFKPFQVRVRGVGYFPGGSRVNVVWLGIDDPSQGLKGILDQLLTLLGKKGFRYDERGFTPHLTIARVKYLKDKAKVLDLLRELRDLEIGSQNVASFRVKKSVLTSSGPVYSDLLVVEAGDGP